MQRIAHVVELVNIHIFSGCGGKFTSLWGVIHSHNYPKNYENNDDCEWLIQVPGNHLINLTFTDFDVETSLRNMITDSVNVSVLIGNSIKELLTNYFKTVSVALLQVIF